MRKHLYSFISCVIIIVSILAYRIGSISPQKPLNVTRWDAFGYYMYLPAVFIYHDYKQLNWLDSIDKKYALTGGNGWQAAKVENGNYTFKYLGGVAVMQLPLFLVGHAIAVNSNYPPDGFSPPYQYALSFGVILYCFLGLLLLRRILLRYYDDATVAVTLLLLCLASNFLEYAGYGNGLSHAYIFSLYVLVLYATLKWHEKPKWTWAALTGYIIGLATMSRPTEAIMLFIPLLWDTNTKAAAKDKWQKVFAHKSHIIAIAGGGLLGILPQLIYWKLSTGSFIYDVGSKWVFLNPWFRVLFGWEKGWFIYTPVTVFFIIGMFFLKKFPFKNTVIWFCLLNIWIIIAWDEWRYGGTYSTRALVQSYPLFALSLAAVTQRVIHGKWRYLGMLLGIYLIGVNIFQTYQYNKTILHFDDMNRLYYGRIYLNPNPSPLDISLMDTDEALNDDDDFKKQMVFAQDSSIQLQIAASDSAMLFQQTLSSIVNECWFKIEASIKAPDHLWESNIYAQFAAADTVKQAHIRLYSPIAENEAANRYAFYFKIPQSKEGVLRVYLKSPHPFEGELKSLRITRLDKH